jgi:hypothetical protein
MNTYRFHNVAGQHADVVTALSDKLQSIRKPQP